MIIMILGVDWLRLRKVLVILQIGWQKYFKLKYKEKKNGKNKIQKNILKNCEIFMKGVIFI